jgi:hypothetical protein
LRTQVLRERDQILRRGDEAALVRVKRENQAVLPGPLDGLPDLEHFSHGGIPILERELHGHAKAVNGLISWHARRNLSTIEQELRPGANA